MESGHLLHLTPIWQWSGSPMECGVSIQPHKIPYFHPHNGTHSRNDPPKNSVGPAQPPPHRCRTFPLLLVQMGNGLLCGLWVWCRRTTVDRVSSNVQSIGLLMDCTAWPFWRMRQSNGCSTPAPRSSAAKQWLEQQLAQKKKNVS